MTQCPVCNNQRWAPDFTVRGHLYHRCVGCHTLYLSDLAASTPEKDAYQGAYLGRGQGRKKTDFSGYFDYEAEEKLHIRTFKQHIRILKNAGAGPKLLDVGCASGHFLMAAARSGFDVAGLDRGEDAIQTVKKRLNCPAWAGDIKDVDPGLTFDTITLWETLEHIPDPIPVLKRLKTSLNPGGLLAIGTGNSNSPLAKALGQFWWYRSPPDHCVIYNPVALTLALRRAGFAIVDYKMVPYHWVGGRNVAMKLLRSAGSSPAMALSVAEKTPNIPLPILHGTTMVALARPL